jgi:hypothetical protein
MPAPPEWLTEFANKVAAFVHPVDALAPLGCHYHQEGAGWEVTLFAARTEIVGGPRDGQQRPSRFGIDVLGMCAVFQSVRAIEWQAQRFSARDELGPHLSIRGDYCGQHIWLRIPAFAPEQFPPGRQAVTFNGEWNEIW